MYPNYFSKHNAMRKEDVEANAENMNSFIRILHAAPRTPNVDIYINDRPTITDLEYRAFTDYFEVPSSTYNIKIYKTGDTSNLLFNEDLFVPPKTVITVAAVKDIDGDLILVPAVETPLSSPTKGKAKVRVAQFIENIPAVDIAIPDGPILYRGLNFLDITDYIELAPGRYDMSIDLADTGIPILYVPNISLKGDKYYTIYLVGLAGNDPSPQALIPLDGITYLKV